jgi:hypothetical protein
MNARVCQLCGKPLSRLRVGGDGDFCSKEHRNQFRLRAGMDRLEEVNKVANLMRRREAARQIPLLSLVRTGETARHNFGDLLPTTIDSAPRLIQLNTTAAARPRIVSYRDTCLRQDTAAQKGRRLRPREHAGEIPVSPNNGGQPQLPAREHSMPVAFPRHGACGLRWQPSEFPGACRDFVKLPPPEVRTHLGDGPEVMRRIGKIWTGAMPQARPVNTFAAEGHALRVSIGVAFRVPKVKQADRRAALRSENALLPVERARALSGERRDCSAISRFLAVNMPEVPAKLPDGPGGAYASGLHACKPMNTRGRMLRDMPAPGPRQTEVNWAAVEPKYRPARLSQTDSGFARRNGAHMFSLKLQANLTQVEPQIETSPFVSREGLCVPVVPYFNVLAAAVTPQGVPEPTPTGVPSPQPMLAPISDVVRYEENFDSGWDNWVGGVSDWKVDVAGVRTGSLALYMPTLDLSDYDLEFLARIDTRTVNWVVRAQGADSHLRCTVTAIEGGQLEFSRTIVQGGVTEAPIPSFTRAPGKPRTTFTVRMSVAGPVFSITIDGKTIDSWVDDRLATGGIGFVGAPDDRARLYWVRVSSPVATSKEHTVR